MRSAKITESVKFISSCEPRLSRFGARPVATRGLKEQEATEITEARRLCFLRLLPLLKARAMHPLFAKASGMTHDVIGAAIEVHKDKGPGLLESIYEWCLTMELALA